jgi:hypothetical protein
MILLRDKVDGFVKSFSAVLPAQAGIHNTLRPLDSGFRRKDGKTENPTYYGTIKVKCHDNARSNMMGWRASPFTIVYYIVPWIKHGCNPYKSVLFYTDKKKRLFYTLV